MVEEFRRFVINKGVDNEFTFNIKETGRLTAMPIVSGDTFVARLIRLRDDVVVLTKSLVVLEAINGRVLLVITNQEASQLESDKANKEDWFYLKPVYRLQLDCKTMINGEFSANVGKVYVR